MTIRTIECGECGAPVPSGRLACPSCGALLAAVAGAPRPAYRVVEVPSPDPGRPADGAGRSTKSKGRAATNGTATAGTTDGLQVADPDEPGAAQPATRRASQAVSRAATAATAKAKTTAAAATAKAKTTAAAATSAVAPTKSGANGAGDAAPDPAPVATPVARPASPGKVAAAIAMAVAAAPTANGTRAAAPASSSRPSSGSRPYPVPTGAPPSDPIPTAAPASDPIAVTPAAVAGPPSPTTVVPAALAAPPSASPASTSTAPARAVRPAPASPVHAAPIGGAAETMTRSSPAQLAYLIEPASDVPPFVRSPQPTTNGSSAYLLDPLPVDDDPDEEPLSPWPPLLQREPSLVPRPYGGVPAGVATATAPRPGAYLPPNSALPPSSVSRPVGNASPGSATPVSDRPATPTSRSDASGSAAAATAGPADAAGPAGSSGVPTTAGGAIAAITSAFDGIDRHRIGEIAGWFVVVGSAMSVLGFLLPWSVVVIGSRGNGGYLDDWGLASPTHLLAVIALLGVLALGVLENPVPAWFRSGVLGLAVGGLLVGLTWPYAIGPLGADIGAMVTFLGGVALLVGGTVASWATRHGRPDPAV
jgi:hypothetical protein